MTNEEFNKKAQEAKKRVEAMDAIDGFKDRNLDTIFLALQSGMLQMSGDDSAIWDAYIMLHDVVYGAGKVKRKAI